MLLLLTTVHLDPLDPILNSKFDCKESDSRTDCTVFTVPYTNSTIYVNYRQLYDLDYVPTYRPDFVLYNIS